MGKQMLDDDIRYEVMDVIKKALSEHFDTDVMAVSASDVVIPVLDAESNEKWAKINISVPRGTRNGHGGYIPYDGYAQAEAYKIDKDNNTHERSEKMRERRRAIRSAKKLLKET